MLINTIKNDMKQAMKNGEKAKLSTYRMLLSKLEKLKITLKLSDVSELTNAQVESAINKNIKELEKEIEAYREVGRTVESQEAEKKLLLTYLPEQLTEDEICKIVDAIVFAVKQAGGNIGTSMAEVSSKLKGKADMKFVSQLVKEGMKKD